METEGIHVMELCREALRGRSDYGGKLIEKKRN